MSSLFFVHIKMVKALSEAVRVQVIAQGLSMSKIASQLKISTKSVSVILKRWIEEHTIQPKARPGRKQKLTNVDKRQIVIHAKRHPESTRQQIKEQLGLNVPNKTISRALKENGLKF